MLEGKRTQDSIPTRGQGKKKRKKKVKKDILAAITFLMTGLLFYAVQTDSNVNELISTGMECEAPDMVTVGENVSEAAMDITFRAQVTKDS